MAAASNINACAVHVCTALTFWGKNSLCTLFTVSVLKPRETVLLAHNTYSFFKFWTRALLDENLLASVSSLFSIQMKKT